MITYIFCSFSLSLSAHTHTDQKRKAPTGLILFSGMKNLSVFIFFFINKSQKTIFNSTDAK